ncbi:MULTISPECIES: YbhB/YbcL family Raf kinase inhibitor-like protein [Vibrio]|uniref:YbhB/YbcL family Raf kinase inhibitor-like protein n=2 Tax=Vibrio TaxID=662 RepID=A0A7X4LQL5_9VIBR|nr:MULTISPECIES: YbhB/YbcL family Raf kinase inhibitor-like protein [Vibrio]MBF9002991.1 YbhB/YbcL family Raf kinase inhibitor-like protein [Vibrio nitrifigilis]MZI95836.1 YbhB/YbcL family Raf kinase inhibitor-like protein [Vibrio eleionomae]
MFTKKITLLCFSIFFSLSSHAFSISSADIEEGKPLANIFVNSGLGCHGDNLSPELRIHDVPLGTKSFAITLYDPDAPTGSGFWHWVVINLSKDAKVIPRGVDVSKWGGIAIRNDFGLRNYGGACPPKGNGMHRYTFTVWALPTQKLDVGDGVTPALIGFMLNKLAISKAVITTTYTKN